jgi:F-type H+-transporting ATPase subunit delta
VDVVISGDAGTDPRQVQQQLHAFGDLFRESADLRNALESPAVSLSRKRAVINRLAAELNLPKMVRNFLLILSDKRRIGALNEIIEAFDVLLDESLGFVRANISSAQEIDEKQREEIARRLSQITGKQVRTRFAVDPELLGGVVARVGSKIYDGSVRGQLAQLSKRFSI